MQSANSTSGLMAALSLATAFAAMMISMWSFAHDRPAWGIYNLVIVLVAFAVMVAVRGRRIDI